MGTVNRQRILNFKRTDVFSFQDYELLVRLVAWFGKLIATPHVLTQVSDLADLSDRELVAARELFKALVEQAEEPFNPSRELVEDPVFRRFGLTDAAISKVCSRGAWVLTTDARLHIALQEQGFDALNFNPIRPLAW